MKTDILYNNILPVDQRKQIVTDQISLSRRYNSLSSVAFLHLSIVPTIIGLMVMSPMVLWNLLWRLPRTAKWRNRMYTPQISSPSLLQPFSAAQQLVVWHGGASCFGRHSWVSYGAMLLLLILLSACGPERASTSEAAAAVTTQEIAATYQATANLDEARAQLGTLEVANVNQWLLLTTESAIKRNDNAGATDALVKLTLDLGLRSTVIVDYARQHGLLAAPVGDKADRPVVADPVAASGGSTANSVASVIVPLAADAAPNPPVAVAEIGDNSPAASEVTTSEGSETLLLTVTVAAEAPTAAAVVATAMPEPTTTPAPQPMVRAASGINVRTGPGVTYALAGAMNAGESAQIVSKNQAGDWWEITLASGARGWVYGSLVETAGDVGAISVALDIPPPPPTAVPAPTQPPTAPVEAAPVEAPPVEAAPVEEPAAPAPGGPDFRVVEKRIWDVVENGGRLDGVSVTCGEKRQLVAIVLDAAGNRLNGVAVQEIYGAQDIYVTGSQGKGDGAVEFVLGGGQALKVVRDADGREVTSEEVYGMSTKPWEIPYEILIGGRFCTDDASCESFVASTGCYGHYSWTVTFQRNY